MPRSRRSGLGKLTLGLGLSLAVLGLLRWVAAPFETAVAVAPAIPAAPASASAASPAAAASAAPVPELAATLTAARSSAPTRLPNALDPAQLAAVERQWCSHFAQAHEQSVASIRPESPFDPAHIDFQRLNAEADAINALLTSRAQYEVQARVLKRWTERLLAQGDAQSRATAAYLTRQAIFGDYQERRQRLARFSAEALASHDPFVVELWAFDPLLCHESDGCRRLPPLRWAEVEPANLLAWLPPLGREAQVTEQQWAGIAQASYARSRWPELQARLLALLPGTAEGLEFEQALGVVERLSSTPRNDFRLVQLQRMCAGQAGDALLRARCAHAAEVMWASPDLDWTARVSAAGLRASFGPPGEQPWADRMADSQSVFERARPLIEGLIQAVSTRPTGCATHPARLKRLRDAVEQGPARTPEQEFGRLVSRP